MPEYNKAIASALKRINHTPLERHRVNLYEFLRFELYDKIPLYYWNSNCPKMPSYFQSILKQIRNY
jgi:hypothetical protein